MPARLSRSEARKLGIHVPAGSTSREPQFDYLNSRFKLKPEEVLAIKCADILRARARTRVIWWHNANEARRSRATWAVQMGMGFLPGLADMTIQLPDPDYRPEACSMIMVEFKVEGKLTLDQRAFAKACAVAFIPYMIIRTPERFVSELDKYGVLT